MTSTAQPTITIPADIVPRFEAWSRLTAQLFQELQTQIAAHDPDQAWFWRESWQTREREADADIAAGRVKHYPNVEALLADLAG